MFENTTRGICREPGDHGGAVTPPPPEMRRGEREAAAPRRLAARAHERVGRCQRATAASISTYRDVRPPVMMLAKPSETYLLIDLDTCAYVCRNVAAKLNEKLAPLRASARRRRRGDHGQYFAAARQWSVRRRAPVACGRGQCSRRWHGPRV